jgi:hypothetical protein
VRLALGLGLVLVALLPSGLGARRQEVGVGLGGAAGGGADSASRLGPAAPAAAGSDATDGADAWLATGFFHGESLPFLDPIDRDWLAGQGGESSARPLAVQRLDALAWNRVPSVQGQVDLTGLEGARQAGVAYAYHEISSPGGGSALLELAAPGPVKLWLNGDLTYARYATETGGASIETVAVDLRPGRNRLLVKVAAGHLPPGFALTLSPPGGAENAPPQGPFRVRILERVVPQGGTLRGILPTPGGAGPGEAASSGTGPAVELRVRDGEGRLLATARARPQGSFSLALPQGHAGPVRVEAESGGFPLQVADAFVGDGGQAARSAAALARAAAAGLPAGAGKGYDARASLSFLADLLEGKANAELASFDGALCAIKTAPALAALGGGELAPGRVWRLAYLSPIDASLQPYSLVLPRAPAGAGDAPAPHPPLLVLLHDSGETDLDAMARLAGAGGSGSGAVVAAPYGRGDSGWTGAGEDDLDAVIAGARAARATDPGRLWLAGWGIGGTGALRWASLHPLSAAAVASFAGLPGRDEADGLRGSAVLLVAGREDGAVTAEAARVAGVKLDRLGAVAELAVVAGGNPQEAWEAWSGGKGGGLLAWFGQRSLPASPRFVEVRAPTLRYGSAPYIRLVDLADPVKPGAASLEVVDARHLALSTENLAAFALDLDGPGLAASGRILLAVDGMAFTVDARSRPSFKAMKAEEGGGLALLPRTGGDVPGDGEEGGQVAHLGGGLADLFRSPLVVVYGTRRAGSAAALRRMALSLADWSPSPDLPFGLSLGRYPVMSDREAEKAGLRGKAILLVGGPADNLMAGRLAPKLVVGLSNGVSLGPGLVYKGAGAVLVQPNPEDPSRLLGIISPAGGARGAEGAAAVVKSLIASLRADPATASSRDSWRTPDLVVFDDKGAKLWAAGFGPDWRELRSWYQ